MTDEIPTGDPTTVPVSELEELVGWWEQYADTGTWDEYSQGVNEGINSCAVELQELIDEHDPKQ